MARKRCKACGALLRSHGAKIGPAENRERSLDKQHVPITPYREDWRERWRQMFGR